MAWVRMLWFHVRRFAQTTFFVQSLVTSTVTMLVLQWLLLRANQIQVTGDPGGVPTQPELWLRAGMAGAWTVTTFSAGMLGFQRFQGTLAHLVNTPRNPLLVMALPVASAATYALLAFPLAAVGASLLGHPPHLTQPIETVLGCLTFWVGCVTFSLVIASLFILTPRAITFEPLLLIPGFFLSGIVSLPAHFPAAVYAVTWIIPTRGAVEALIGSVSTPTAVALTASLALASSLATSLAWTAVAAWCGTRALRAAITHSTLDLQ